MCSARNILGFLAVSLAVITTCLVSHGDVPKEAREVRSAEAAQFSASSAVGFCYELKRLLDYPLCIEEQRRRRDDAGNPSAGSAEKVSFEVLRNESLAHALDRVVELSQGGLEWRVVNGMACVLPTVSPGKENPAPYNCMERRISFRVDSVTTWGALKALAIQVNLLPDTQYPLIFQPIGIDQGCSHKPPREFTEEPAITLDLKNVTVRETICAIFSHSPVTLSYLFVPGDDDDVIVFFHRKEMPGLDRPTAEDEAFWVRQLRQVRTAFERVKR